jgi:probable rRNA maturation factor
VGTVLELGGEGLQALSAADRAWLAASIESLVPALGVPLERAAVEVVRDARMRALHARHMGLDSTTDVLTFAQNGPGEPVDVDIAICVDEAMRRGAGAPHGARGELLLFALHALLHACGHDDRDEASFRRMHAEEDRILEAAGFGRLFEAGEATP